MLIIPTRFAIISCTVLQKKSATLPHHTPPESSDSLSLQTSRYQLSHINKFVWLISLCLIKLSDIDLTEVFKNMEMPLRGEQVAPVATP